MKRKKEVGKLCGAVYEDRSGKYLCGKPEEHRGKHLSTTDGVFVSWTEEGLLRQAQERHGVSVE